jgi:hypothetical protein
MHTLKRAITTSGRPSSILCGNPAESYMICQFFSRITKEAKKDDIPLADQIRTYQSKSFLGLLQCHSIGNRSLPGDDDADKRQKIC